MTRPEELLHFIWKFRLFDQFNLKTQTGDPIKIIHPGQHNHDAGPDFELAKIQIGQQLWVGNVEIHWTAKEWYAHQHHQDEKYNNVVLHIIYDQYTDVHTAAQYRIPTLRLCDYVSPQILCRYETIMHAKSWMPCEGSLRDFEVENLVKVQLLQRMLLERLEFRYLYVLTLLEQYKNDWEKVALILLGRAFGMRVNKSSFEKLSSLLSLTLLEKYQKDILKIEAMVFGQAGFLDDEYADDDYFMKLKNVFQYLNTLHRLPNMSETEWKFLRMRPANFPTIRLAQFAALLQTIPRLFSHILTTENLDELYRLLVNISVSPYWKNHVRFGTLSQRKVGQMTNSFFEHLVINCFSVVLFSYGKYVHQQEWMDRAVDWLDTIAPEHNSIVQHYTMLGLTADRAGDSQALLHLKQHYCDQRKCLDCQIGKELISRI